MTLLRPPSVSPGATLGIVSPGRWLDETSLGRVCSALEERGYRTKVHAQNHLRLHQFAGSDEERLRALHDVFKDPDVDAVLCAKGGYGALRVLDRVDLDVIGARPKALVGYSDITALMCLFFSKLRMPGFHGPMGLSIAQGVPAWSLDLLLDSLRATEPYTVVPRSEARIQGLRIGEGSGRLIGGNLCILANMIGTPGEPDVSGAVLFVEDIDEHWYALDRLFLHLKRAGWLARLAGLIVGDMIDMKDNEIPFGFSLEQIVLDACAGTSYPIVCGVPLGHVRAPLTLPFGVASRLTVREESMRLDILEPPVQG